MTATNHVLSGATIVAVVPNPIVALILALLSHFVLDALPHLGIADARKNLKKFCTVLFLDCTFAAAILLAIIINQPDNWQLLVAGGVVAASPDLASIPLFISWLKGKPDPAVGFFQRFHGRLQWGERPWGWIFEVPYALVMTWLLVRLV